MSMSEKTLYTPLPDEDHDHELELKSERRDDESEERDAGDEDSTLLLPRPRPQARRWAVIGLLSLTALAILLILAFHAPPAIRAVLLGKTFNSAQSTDSMSPRKAVILSSFQAQKVDWLRLLNVRPDGTPDTWEIFRYVADATEDAPDILTVDNPHGRDVARLPYLHHRQLRPFPRLCRLHPRPRDGLASAHARTAQALGGEFHRPGRRGLLQHPLREG